MPDTTSRIPSAGAASSTGAPRTQSAASRPASSPVARPAGGPNGNAGAPVRPVARPAGGPNGNGGLRTAPPRPSAPGGARPGGPPRPGGGPGRPGGGPGRGGQHRGGPRGGHGRGHGAHAGPTAPTRTVTPVRPAGPIEIPAQVVVKDLAELLSTSVNEVIRTLIGIGIFAAINQVVNYDAASKVATALGMEPVEAQVQHVSAATKRPEATQIGARASEPGRVARPPVVTVMGHVDHGKTSLLDAIRNTRVAAGEAGGITQHIGAYQVEVNGRKVTFLDTPGHEAFTQMRARGAQATDIAVIVVAADDGVMPQTQEAIDHARAAKVPLVVAINKIDKPGANPDRVKQQLADVGVVIEEYGGEVIAVPVSAKKGTGINELLEMLLLVADIEDLKANPSRKAQGVIIEARVDRTRGVTATALIQEGSLKLGDTIVVGTIYGKVRAMFDDTGKSTKKATPSSPVSILGLSEVPSAGDVLQEVENEKAARELVQQRKNARDAAQSQVTLDTLFMQMQEGKVKELNLLIKADVQGSLEALRHALSRTGSETLKVRLIHDGVGNVSETDVHLAAASKAIIIAFNVQVDVPAQRIASNDGVDIRSYEVIYKLADDIEAALQGLLEPVYKEQVDGHAEVLQLFKAGKRIIAGCRVTDGKITRSSQARVMRGGKEVFNGLVESLRRGKEDAREVLAGYECGILMEDYNELTAGDIVEAFSMVRV
ncbi:MAG: translation initiation factor IF-2 [Ktedonobacterales bacterium]